MNAIGWVSAVVTLIVLWQFTPLHPIIVSILALILIGLLLRNWSTIFSQFKTIGGK